MPRPAGRTLADAAPTDAVRGAEAWAGALGGDNGSKAELVGGLGTAALIVQLDRRTRPLARVASEPTRADAASTDADAVVRTAVGALALECALGTSPAWGTHTLTVATDAASGAFTVSGALRGHKVDAPFTGALIAAVASRALAGTVRAESAAVAIARARLEARAVIAAVARRAEAAVPLADAMARAVGRAARKADPRATVIALEASVAIALAVGAGAVVRAVARTAERRHRERAIVAAPSRGAEAMALSAHAVL